MRKQHINSSCFQIYLQKFSIFYSDKDSDYLQAICLSKQKMDPYYLHLDYENIIKSQVQISLQTRHKFNECEFTYYIKIIECKQYIYKLKLRISNQQTKLKENTQKVPYLFCARFKRKMNSQMNQKLIAIVEKKLESEENILSIIGTMYYFPVKNPAAKKIQDSLIISTHRLFCICGSQIKKIIQIKHINYLTLAILGNQIILHCQKGDWIRIQSSEIINIIGNILLAKEKFLLEKGPFTIHLQIQKTLQNLTQSQIHKKSFFSIFSKKKDKQSLTASGRRTSFSTIQVNQKNFILQIGKKAYKAIFQNAQLLHISGDASGFRFDAQNYQYRDLNSTDTLYWRQNHQDKVLKRYLRRKIIKVSDYQTEILHRNLSNYKLNDYNEDILFALELDTHFQILTQVFESWIYCWEYLIHYNNYQSSLANGNQTISEETLLTEVELRSIFYKLHTFIEEESHKNHILSSFGLDYVYICNGDARISTVFCKVISRINVSYIAPQQFKSLGKRLQKNEKKNGDKKGSFVELRNMDTVKRIQEQNKSFDGEEQFTPLETYKINLWKLGMFLYQLAYHKLPFPIEYVAYKMKHHQHIKVHFPQRDHHSIQFHHFLKSLICKDPQIRGIRLKGDVRMSVLNPQIANIMEHQWVIKSKK